ncbi:uncharacterized protein LOC136074520 [Hydra vulgaris]|uniref:Uncharacterized protein LOC136074520 n=1 Tax=Hydra vulgaris TaxID=6087 RepID=A0ABM4B2A6_HYDVU
MYVREGKKRISNINVKDFEIVDNKLMNCKKGVGKVVVVIDREEQLNIVKEVHEGLGASEKAVALASNLGINAVRKQISTRFCWHSIVKDITKHVTQCERCQKTSNRILKVSCFKTCYSRQHVMKQVGVDLIKLPASNGLNYAIVLIDYFSMWTEAEPLIDKTEISVALFLYKVICRHGCFQIQINDQGREFVNSVSIALHDMAGV